MFRVLRTILRASLKHENTLPTILILYIKKALKTIEYTYFFKKYSNDRTSDDPRPVTAQDIGAAAVAQPVGCSRCKKTRILRLRDTLCGKQPSAGEDHLTERNAGLNGMSGVPKLLRSIIRALIFA